MKIEFRLLTENINLVQARLSTLDIGNKSSRAQRYIFFPVKEKGPNYFDYIVIQFTNLIMRGITIYNTQL